jgi:hypothetical protein
VKEQIIELEQHDDIITIKDRLAWLKATQVLLVIPPVTSRPILRGKLDLLLIQREATRQQANLALITTDPELEEIAFELNIPAFHTLEASHKARWRHNSIKPAMPVPVPDNGLSRELIEGATRLGSSDFTASFPTSAAINRNIVASFLVIILLALLIIAPQATVKLDPVRSQTSVTVPIIADPSLTKVDVTNALIPARIVGIDTDATATVETTGTTDRPSTRAHGTALFTNLIPEQATIPAGTIVRTSAAIPVRFVTLADATIPGKVGATVEVSLEAIEAGYEGNLPANRINQVEGVLSTRLAVTNPTPSSGGDVVQIRAISSTDFQRVRNLAIQQLDQRAFAEFQTNPLIHLSPSEFVPPESLAVVIVESETYSGNEGQASDTLELQMNATVQGVAIDQTYARQIVYALLSQKIGEGFRIDESAVEFRLAEVTAIDDQRRITFIMYGSGDAITAIDTQELSGQILGRTRASANEVLMAKLQLLSEPQISIWPEFWPLIPLLPSRIEFVYR